MLKITIEGMADHKYFSSTNPFADVLCALQKKFDENEHHKYYSTKTAAGNDVKEEHILFTTGRSNFPPFVHDQHKKGFQFQNDIVEQNIFRRRKPKFPVFDEEPRPTKQIILKNFAR